MLVLGCGDAPSRFRPMQLGCRVADVGLEPPKDRGGSRVLWFGAARPLGKDGPHLLEATASAPAALARRRAQRRWRSLLCAGRPAASPASLRRRRAPWSPRQRWPSRTRHPSVRHWAVIGPQPLQPVRSRSISFRDPAVFPACPRFAPWCLALLIRWLMVRVHHGPRTISVT